MEFSTDSSKKIEAEFADVLFSYLLGDSDHLGVAQALGEIAARKDVELVKKKSKNTNFSLESQLWDLAYYLVENRERQIPVTDHYDTLSKKFNSSSAFLDNYLNNNSSLKEIWIIMYWIQSNLYTLEAPQELKSAKWNNTKLKLLELNLPLAFKVSNDGSNLVSSLDYDAPLREGKALAAADSEDDRQFFYRLYSLILRKKDEEALELCQQTGNWTYYMILQGVHDYLDPLIDTTIGAGLNEEAQGIKNRSLWISNCYSLAQDSEDKYQRGLMEYLSGGVKYNLELNKGNWEYSLLVYLNAFLMNKLDDHLVDLGLVQDHKVNELYNCNNIEDILTEVSNLPEMKLVSANNLRQLMGSLMVDRVPELIDSFLSEDYNYRVLEATERSVYSDMDDEITDITEDSEIKYKDDEADYEETYDELEQILADDPHYDNYNVYLLRVFVHLAIYLKLVGYSQVTSVQLVALVKLYLKKLFKKGEFDILPIYIKVIPVESEQDFLVQKSIYSYYLSKILLLENRLKQIKTCQILEINNLKEILLDTVDIISSRYEEYYLRFMGVNKDLVVISDDVSEVDQIYMHSIDYFLNFKSLKTNAVESINQIFTKFILSGKISSALEFYRSYDFRDIIKNADVEINVATNAIMDDIDESNKLQLDQYYTSRKHLFSFLSIIENGLLLLHKYDEYLLEKNLNPAQQSSANLVGWKNKIIKEDLVRMFIDPLKDLIFNQLVTLEISDNHDLNTYFKNLYVPFFVISLHKTLVNSRFCDAPNASDAVVSIGNKFLKQAIDISVKVANGKNGFIQYFQKSNRLKEYLTLIAECSAIAGEDIIYY